MKIIKKITTSRSLLDSEVDICDVAEDGTENGYETLHVVHSADATAADRQADIDAAVAAATTPGLYSISISADGVWAGSGLYEDGAIRDCAAVLGGSQDAADAVYEAIEDAIAGMAQPANGHLDHGGVRYSWQICTM